VSVEVPLQEYSHHCSCQTQEVYDKKNLIMNTLMKLHMISSTSKLLAYLDQTRG